jgi:hypothetical protein
VGDKFVSAELEGHAQDCFLALIFFGLSESQFGVGASPDIHLRTWRV